MTRMKTEKGNFMQTRILYVLCISVFMLLSAVEAKALTISIDPLNTYLFTNNDPWSGNGSVPGTIPIVLSELGIGGGDLIQLERLGDWYDGHAGYGGDVSSMDVVREMIGVFSSGSTLLAPNLFSRVPGALDAGVDITTWNTLFGNMATDIGEDFGIDNIFVQVPVGATHLFVAAHDIYYSDNSDPDGDFAVRITPVSSVPEPSALLLLALGFFGLVLYSRAYPPTAIRRTFE